MPSPRGLLALLAAAALAGPACGRSRAGAPQDTVAPPAPAAATADAGAEAAGTLACEALPFAATIPIAEASGAVYLPDNGGLVLVVSDSGNHGDYVELAADTGALVRAGKLPLAHAGDDLEGLAVEGDLIWGITSAGWLRAWRRTDDGYRIAVEPYHADPADTCGAHSVNCGPNFEGLCLVPPTVPGGTLDGCAGFAASKAHGTLVCLVRVDGQLVLDEHRTRPVTVPHALADCVIGADGAIWTGDNLFGASRVRRVTGGARDAASLGAGFPEAMTLGPPAADGSVTLYRFSDTGGAPSAANRYRCRPKAAPPAPGE